MFMPSNPEWKLAGCGYTAISLLSGINPVLLKSINKGSEDATPTYMLRTLKALGFHVTKLDRSKMTGYQRICYLNDVVLARTRMTKGDASWLICHAGNVYHNYEILDSSYLSAINFPIMSSYKIVHYKWLSVTLMELSHKLPNEGVLRRFIDEVTDSVLVVERQLQITDAKKP